MIDKTHIPDNDVEAVAELKIARDLIVAELGKAIIGQREIIDQL